MAGGSTASLNLWGILSESKRIIHAHSRHFLALSVMFLLPLSFSLTVSPSLLSSNTHILLSLSLSLTQGHQNPLPFILLFLLSLLLLSLFAFSSITHSVFHGFFGRPVKLPSALLSIAPSFLPLLSASLILYPPLPLLPFLRLPLPLSLLLLPCLLYLRLLWTLAPVVAVLESSWAARPLLRSASLLRGMAPVAASSILFFSSLYALLLCSTSLLATADHHLNRFAFLLRIVLTSALLVLLLLYNAAADTVLYMYCKAVHGELAADIADEFAWQYVSLPFDDAKVPHVVSVVTA